MKTRHKIILSNNHIYKEIELSPEAHQVKVGTGVDCDVRLRKDLFFSAIELVFIKTDSQWSVYCADNLYLTVGDIRKFVTKKLEHGDVLQIKYQESDNLVFSVEFLIDFDDGKRKYDRCVNVESAGVINIGSAKGNHLVLGSSFVKNDQVKLVKKQNSYVLDIQRTTYGVHINGRKAQSGDIVRSGDFLSVSDFFFYYKEGKLWTEERTDLGINGLSYLDSTIRGDYPKFNRNTRLKTVVCEDEIEILDPPEVPKKPKESIIQQLLPSMGMFLAAGVMVILYNNPTMLIMSGMTGCMSIITGIMTIRNNRKEYKEGVAERIEKYNAYIAGKREEIEQCRSQEQSELEELYVSQSTVQQRFRKFSPSLFDRSKEDDDYLCVRLGSGEVESKREIHYKKQEKLELGDELQQLPAQICDEYQYVHDAPVVCDLKQINALGIVGPAECRFDLLKNIVIDLAARQFFSDVKMAFVAEKEHKEHVRWLRMLPHAYNETIGVRNIVCDDESKNLIFEYLYKELTLREQAKKYEENIIVFFYDEYGFKTHPISKFVEKAKDLGVTFVFFGDSGADIPQGCGYVISIHDQKSAVMINTQNKGEATVFKYPRLSNEKAEDIVRLLAPVHTEEISLEGTLTKNISLFEMLNILAVDDLDLEKRWKNSQVFKSMAAPLGVSKTGIVSLDLHDKAHGPHGLVAGTTGSGKSEILQTYILSMATLFSPTEVGFVIIDFKGGGMVNQFKDMPHLMGAITNIDGKEINRSLKSIKAELQKRQRYFAAADVNHIDKYIRKYQAGEVLEPLPHLIIIVDEFAELKAEQPEFMKELISAARIGRSLGVHLILATQKPSGQVNEQIWSNSRFKLCLKVQGKEDSNEVLKSPLAAEIKEPGRAYLQVGNNEIFELFQSAYSGAPERADDSHVREFTICALTDSGRRVPVYVQKKKKSGEGSSTQLEAVIRHVAGYCQTKGLQKLPDICLPSLSHSIEFATKPVKDLSVYDVEIGIYDDPENQYQGVYSIDLASNNLMMIGSSQSGKTNILQDIIRSLSSKYTPKEVSIYVVDFASMVLKNFEKLNHVGGVVCPSEDEKLKNLFKLLREEMETRRERLMSVGVSSFAAYKGAGMTDMPLIVLMVDNLTALKELYFQDDDELLKLCREGLTVGISIVISNAQTTGIGYKYLSNFSSRIALFCNDSNEYSSLFDHCRERVENIPGRCIVELEKRHLDCQAYLAFEGEKEIDRVKEIRNYVSETNRVHKNAFARKIPLIPASLTQRYVTEEYGAYMQNRYNVVAGLDYSTVTPCVLDFASLGLLAIAGREKSGRHNWLQYSVNMLNQQYPGMTKVYVVDGISKKLRFLQNAPGTTAYSIVTEDAVTYIKDMEKQLKERYDALVAGNDEVLNSAELLMLVLDNQDAMLAICNDRDGLAAYKNIVGRYKNMKACIITFVDNANIPYSAPEMLKNLRDQRHFMIFEDTANIKLFDVPLAVTRKFKKQIEMGDGYYFKDNECAKLKTPLCRKGG